MARRGIRKFHLLQCRESLHSRGAVLFILSIIIAMTSIIILGLNMYLVRKNDMQIGVMKYTRKEGLINAILDHAVNELRTSFAAGGSCSLAPLVAATSTNFRSVAPQRYHVGQFQLDILKADGTPTGRFESPEDPPMVYIEQIGSSSLFRINIETTICRDTMGGGYSGRTKIPKTDVDAAVTSPSVARPWPSSPPPEFTWPGNPGPYSGSVCPEKIPLNYTGIVDPSSWGGIWTVYFDRGYHSNLSQAEPAEYAEIDVEEFYNGVESSEYIGSEKTDVHYTGATDEKSMPGTTCAGSSRTASAYLQAIDLIRQKDPCGRMAIYTVGGGASVGVAPSPPWLIAPVTNPSGAIAGYLPITTNWSTLTSATGGVLQMCGKKPAGYFNIPEVARHYVTNHQAPLHTLPASDKTKTHTLVLVTDATGFGIINPPSIPAPVIRSNIYYKNSSCTGQGYIESANLNISPTNWYVAGDILYEADLTAAVPVAGPIPTTNPPLPPLPGGTSAIFKSVKDGITGNCALIFQPDSVPGYEVYSGVEYPFYLKSPYGVKARIASPTTMRAILDDYTPYKDWIDSFKDIVNDTTNGIKEYPNAFMMIPLPVTDLDEADIDASSYSKRQPFDLGDICKKDRESIAVGYSQVFSMLDLKKFSTRASYEGLICD